jgi:peptidoglycan/xylan/chitin deacetylase (PgdA/CDA1 family)
MVWSFDDGPNEHSTRQNMDVLEAHGITGTFFLVGQHVERHPAIAREIHDRGHRVGNHSYSHPNLRTLSRDGVLDELVRCETAIIEARVPRPTVFRPPYGETDDQVELVASELGLEQLLGTVDSADWKSTTEQIIENVLSTEPTGDDVVLLHDVTQTTRALPALLERFRDSGSSRE